MIALIMLVLLALPAFGTLTSVSSSLSSNGQQSESEEVEEWVPSSSQRRHQRIRLNRDRCSLRVVNRFRSSFFSGSFFVPIERPVVNRHRLPDGSLAPIRC